MSIKKLNEHYSFTNPASIHDEEALTALELAGRTANKVNEVVQSQNDLIQDQEDHREEVEKIQEDHVKEVKEMCDNNLLQAYGRVSETFVRYLNDGVFAETFFNYYGGLVDRLNTLAGGLTEGSTTLDTEVIGLRSDFTKGSPLTSNDVDYEPFTNAWECLKIALSYVPFAHGTMVNGTDVDLNHWAFTDPGVYSFCTLVNLSNYPEAFNFGLDDDVIIYLKTEATDRVQLNEKAVFPRGIQTIFNSKNDKVYQRFYNCTNTEFGTDYEFTEWKPAHVSNTFRILDQSVDLNGIVEEDRYIIAVEDCINSPVQSGALLNVSRYSRGWIVQTLFGLHNNPCMYYRVASCPSQTRKNFDEHLEITWSEWKQIKTTDMRDHEDLTASGVDLNGLIEPKTYTVAVEDSVNNPGFERGYLVEVISFNNGWFIQRATSLYPDTVSFYRTGFNVTAATHKKNFEEGLEMNWSEWSQSADLKTVEEMIKSSGGSGGSGAPLPWAGKKIAVLGDSICGNFRDSSGVCAQIEALTGATVDNFAIGGTRIVRRWETTFWKKFDLSNFIDSWINGSITNWVYDDYDPYVNEGLPEYVPEIIEKMKTCSPQDYDLIVIVSGTNDFYSVSVETGFELATFENTILENLEGFYKTRYLFVCPMFRSDMPNDSFDPTFDFYSEPCKYDAGIDMTRSLKELNDQIIEVCDKKGIPSLNTLMDLGINRYNSEKYLLDGVHPNEEGRKILARYIAGKINQM